jgi:hypothetical protein
LEICPQALWLNQPNVSEFLRVFREYVPTSLSNFIELVIEFIDVVPAF